MSAMLDINLRFISSGKGLYLLFVRKPASKCTILSFLLKAAIANIYAVVVSP